MLEAPWALLALLSLPILIWIHRRRRQGVPVDVPSLLFLEPEDMEATAPDRRRFDAELALTLAAAACLALAAAGPRVAVGAPAPRVRVVLDASPAMEAKATPISKSPREQAEAAIAALGLSDSIVRARGKPTDLVAAARREPADVRLVVSDRAITPAPPDVHVAAYGDPAVENVGIVAVHVEPDGRVHVACWNQSRVTWRGGLSFGDVYESLALPAEGAARIVGPIPPGANSLVLRLVGALAGTQVDAMTEDDQVEIAHAPLTVGFSLDLPISHRMAVEQVLTAVMGADGWRDGGRTIELGIGSTRTPGLDEVPSVLLHALAQGERGVPVSSHVADEGDPVLFAVDAAGAEVRGPSGSANATGPPLVRRYRVKGREDLHYEWMADPLAGSPAPVDTPAWPVFWANLVERLRGDQVGGGWRALGVLDPDVTRLGRDRIPIDPAWIAAAKPAAPEPKDLRLPLVVGGALCLLLLWFAPRGGRSATVG